MPTLTLPPAVASHLADQTQFALRSTSLSGCVAELESDQPTLFKLLFAGPQTLNGYVNLYHNEELVSDQLDSDRPLSEGDVLEVVVSVAGG